MAREEKIIDLVDVIAEPLPAQGANRPEGLESPPKGPTFAEVQAGELEQLVRNEVERLIKQMVEEEIHRRIREVMVQVVEKAIAKEIELLKKT